jgi:uncharacterized protein YkwD
VLAALAACVCVPAGAQARVPCANEDATPTTSNTAQVSDVIVCLTNQLRANFGVPALRRDACLDAAAQAHSEDMAARRYLAPSLGS